MSTLRELAGAYLETAVTLKLAIQDQEKSLDALPGGQRRAAERDLALLRQMLRETREVGYLVRHYYDPAYWRDERYIC